VPKQAPLLLVAIACLVVALYFTLTSDVRSDLQPGGSEDAAVESGVEPSAAPAEAGVDEGEPASLSAQGESERAEVVTGHRVRVLNTDGRPAVGVRVRAFVPEQERVDEFSQYWRDLPDEVMWGSPSAEHLLTNAVGEVMLPSFEFASVSVTEAARCGHVICEARADDPGFAHILQLRATPMIEIRVLDVNGDPVNDDYQLVAHVAEATKADALPANASGWDQGQVWKYHTAIGKLSDGRHMIGLELSARTAEWLGPVDGPLRYRVALNGGQVLIEAREFDASETGPIVFQYPAQGSMAIQLVGYPRDALPYLKIVTDAEGAPSAATGTLSEDGAWYEFDGLPIGEQFDVNFLTRSLTSENTERLAHTHLPRPRLAGPTTPGERVEHRLEFGPPPGFYGRFVFPKEMPISAEDFAYLANRSTSASSKILFASGQRSWDWAECSVFADGSFFVPVDRLRRQKYDIRNVGAIAFQWVQDEPEEELRPEVWVPARIWATPSARSTSLDDAVDLGEVPISIDGPLMKVRVVDGEGEPLPGATIKLEYQQKHYSEGGFSDYFSDANYRPGLTDDLGESWILGRDWFAALGVRDPSSLKQNESGQQLHRVRITASHPSASAASRTLFVSELGQKTLEIRLGSSGSIVGSVIPPRLLPFLDIAVIPPGADYGDSWRKTGVERAWVDFRNQREPAEKPFEIMTVPPGLWDVVFSVRRYGAEEFHRVPGVQVFANEVCEDPRLASVALEGLVGFTRLVLRDGSGRSLDKSTVSEFDPTIVTLVRGGGVTLDFQWVDGAIVLPIPIGESADLAITAEGWESLVLRAASDGEIQATIRRTQAATLRINGLQALPEGMSLELTLQPGQNYFARASWKSNQADPSKVLLRTTGEHTVSWFLKAGEKHILGAQSTVQITAGQVYSGADLELDLPQSIVDSFDG
jgi:hypothetical protein